MISDAELFRLVNGRCEPSCWRVMLLATGTATVYHVNAPTRRSAGALAREYYARFTIGAANPRPRVAWVNPCQEGT